MKREERKETRGEEKEMKEERGTYRKKAPPPDDFRLRR